MGYPILIVYTITQIPEKRYSIVYYLLFIFTTVTISYYFLSYYRTLHTSRTCDTYTWHTVTPKSLCSSLCLTLLKYCKGYINDVIFSVHTFGLCFSKNNYEIAVLDNPGQSAADLFYVTTILIRLVTKIVLNYYV